MAGAKSREINAQQKDRKPVPGSSSRSYIVIDTIPQKQTAGQVEQRIGRNEGQGRQEFLFPVTYISPEASESHQGRATGQSLSWCVQVVIHSYFYANRITGHIRSSPAKAILVNPRKRLPPA